MLDFLLQINQHQIDVILINFQLYYINLIEDEHLNNEIKAFLLLFLAFQEYEKIHQMKEEYSYQLKLKLHVVHVNNTHIDSIINEYDVVDVHQFLDQLNKSKIFKIQST